MSNWTNKTWGAAIGVLLVFLIVIIGWGPTALAILIGLVGYFIGKYLDGEIDLEEIRARAQGRAQGRRIR